MTKIDIAIFRYIMDDLKDAVIVTDANSLIMHLNIRASNLLRVPFKEAQGQSLQSLLCSEIAKILLPAGQKALATGHPINLESQRLFFPKLGYLYCDIRILPYRRADDKTCIVHILHEIETPKYQGLSSEMARNFLARMSHEIRTPMNGIIGMTELALQGETPQDIEECLDIIKSSADSLLVIINDILDFSAIESGHRLNIVLQPISMRNLLNEIMTILKLTSIEKNIALSWVCEENVPEILIGDSVRIRQIITNLVGNALKFTENGSVSVRLEKAPAISDISDGKFPLQCTVTDTGIGIPTDKIPTLFEPFVQHDKDSGYGGTGLGLAVARSLVRQMGGEMEARNAPNRGSIFLFHIRLKKPTHPLPSSTENTANPSITHEKVQTPQWNNRRVLLVEDNRVNRIVTESLLKKVGLTVLTCNDGDQAVQLWEKEQPDVILMDLQMSQMDGDEACRCIRNIEKSKKIPPVPIVALTAHVLAEEKKRAQKAGMNGWLTKPVLPKKLYAELERLMPPTGPREKRERHEA